MDKKGLDFYGHAPDHGYEQTHDESSNAQSIDKGRWQA